MVAKGWSEKAAIDWIYQRFGQDTPITEILKRLRKEKLPDFPLQPPQPASTAGLAELSKNPRTLHLLWEEYQNGIGTRKAARLFSIRERNQNKQTKGLFCRRKPFWVCIERLVSKGIPPRVAIDRVYQVYGAATPVTAILRNLSKDQKKGGSLPELLR